MDQHLKVILTSSLIIAIFMTIIVLWNTPSVSEVRKGERNNKAVNFARVFVLSFGVAAATLYFMQDNDCNSMMTNIIKGEPDF